MFLLYFQGVFLLLKKEKVAQKPQLLYYSNDVFKGKGFEFAQVDVEVPDRLCQKFSEIAQPSLVQEKQSTKPKTYDLLVYVTWFRTYRSSSIG